MEDLKGRVAVVTGAAGGIGRAMADRFAAEGMSVVLADIDADQVRAAADDIATGSGADVLAVRADVSSASDVCELAEQACKRFGTVHVVCNNAGVIGQWSTAWETSAAEWRWVLDVNLWGVVNGIKAFVPILVGQNEGHVVNTASLAAWESAPGSAAYAASKHAVLGLSEVLRLELEAMKSAVGVSVLCPQFVNTSLLSAGRNWPMRLGRAPAPPEGRTKRVRDAIEGAITRGSAPSAVAEVVVEGIRTNRFLVTEDEASIASSADRRAAIARGADPGSAR